MKYRPTKNLKNKLFTATLASATIAVAVVFAGALSGNASASSEPVSLWTSSTTPTNTSASDSSSVELGVKFKPTEDGSITGIKFYKGSGNGGTHTGSLWSSSGSLLASATFTSETSSGWQEVSFTTPVEVDANTQYTASYFAPQGHYAYDYNYFDTARVEGPLTAPASGDVSGNGVYTYSSTSAFPTSSYSASNYWVDVNFVEDEETITHGSQITLSNTGYTAWRGTSNETCTLQQMTVYEDEVDASELGSTATCVWLKGGINIDANITLNACRIDAAVNTFPQFNHINLNYCTIDPTTTADVSLGAGNFTATRCQILGSSDGVRYAGTTADTLIENYIRTEAQSSEDHNDGIQAYGAEGGGVILRNNVDANPSNSSNEGNAALFIADGAEGTFEIRDNYLSGGGYSLRLHESAYYRVTGNIIEEGSYLYDALNTAYSIEGAFLEFSNNKLSDNTAINL